MNAEHDELESEHGARAPDGVGGDAEIRPDEGPMAPTGDAMAGTEPAVGDAVTGTESPAAARDPLLPDDRSRSFRERWERIQVTFVDEPQTSVEEADRLVLEVIQQLQSSFAAEREALEAQWQRGGDVETEQLRVALQRYRSFFDRLLAA